MTSFHVPANQSVSWTVYLQSVSNESNLSHDFISQEMKRVHRAFDHGEPIWMIVEELKLIFECRSKWRPEKTPLQLARRVVRR